MISKTTTILLAACVLSLTLMGQEPATTDKSASAQEMNSWAKQVGKRLRSENPNIRRSAEAAIVALGRAAMPQLRRLADASDDERSRTAKRLMSRIEKNAKRFSEMKRRRGQGGPDTNRSGQRPPNRQKRPKPQSKESKPAPVANESKPEIKKPTPEGNRLRRSQRRPDRGSRRSSNDPSKASSSAAKRVASVAKKLELDEATTASLKKAVDRLTVRQKEIGSLLREGEMKRDEVRPQFAAALSDFRGELVKCLGEENAQKAMRSLRLGGRENRSDRRGARRESPEGDDPSRRRRPRKKKDNADPKPAVIL
ncbi:MAG: hypothetical protein QGF59_20400 [Pirellulaceae bacterium]|nr:hypothetical protein [Pirellulaceae bacterium]